MGSLRKEIFESNDVMEAMRMELIQAHQTIGQLEQKQQKERTCTTKECVSSGKFEFANCCATFIAHKCCTVLSI